MNLQDAANILGLSGEVTPEVTKKAYRVAAQKYHPDRNPAGLQMMQAINAAYALLREYTGTFLEANTYADHLNDALNAVIHCQGITIEICGNWVWLSGETKQHKKIFMDAGYKFAGKKKMWFFRPDEWKSSNRLQNSIDDIREVYGSRKVQGRVAESIE
jgi:hypothetical protein